MLGRIHSSLFPLSSLVCLRPDKTGATWGWIANGREFSIALAPAHLVPGLLSDIERYYVYVYNWEFGKVASRII
jgi:hypothetical protein